MYFSNNVPRNHDCHWDGSSWEDLYCGVCYSIGGGIRRGVALRFVLELEHSNWVGVMIYKHHYCRSEARRGGSFLPGERGSIRNYGGYAWMGNTEVGLFYILCNGNEGLPDANTGGHAYWETRWLN